MTERRKQAIRDFLFAFGTGLTFRCGLPQSAPGSTKKDSIFGCNGNKCLHLPKILQGDEVLVIDTPLKVALHSSCKERLINSLDRKHVHLDPSKSPGLCFNSQAASNKPPYPAMIDSIIESCFVQESQSHVIHIADFGFRLPIMPGTPECPLNIFFTRMKKMSDEGVMVELVQLDVAFSVPVREEKLVQFSCRRNNDQKSVDSLLNGSTVKVHPLHQLPNPHDEPIIARNVKGTISLKKDIKRWNTETNSVNIGNSNNDEWQEDESRDVVCDLYRYQNNGEKRLHEISTYRNIVYSVKIYSTIAHWLLQTRSRFPLTEKQIYGVGNRSFAQLQALLKNIGSVSKKGFAIVKKHGILSRIEFSIRPHHKDGLRTRGHYNDFLLHVYLAAHDLCVGTEYEFHFRYIDSLPTQTKVMTMISEALTYLRFSASNRFNMVYCDPRLTVWLRAHVSLLLITTGYAPEYGTKHLNNWLRDKDRWDPFKRSWTLERPVTGLNGPQPNPTSLSSRTKEELRIFLSGTLHFSTEGIKTLLTFFDSYTSNLDPMFWYEKFSLLNKLRLSRWILDEIIPHISQFMARKVGEKYKKDRRWNQSLREIQDPKEQFNELLGPSDTMTQHEIEKAPFPKDPVSRSIHSLLQLGTFSDLHRPIFTILLFKFILRCHSDKICLPQERRGGYLQLRPLEDRTRLLLNKCVGNGVALSNKELQKLCALLEVHMVGANRKKRLLHAGIVYEISLSMCRCQI